MARGHNHGVGSHVCAKEGHRPRAWSVIGASAVPVVSSRMPVLYSAETPCLDLVAAVAGALVPYT